MLANTAVHQPAGAAAPSLIRLARTPALRHAVCAATPAFVRATTALSRPPLPAAVRDAFAAPYGSADRRRAVEEFVADIPFEPGHVSAATLDEIAEEVRKLDDVPALLLWWPRDPVFSDRYLRDLRRCCRRASSARAGIAPRAGGRAGGRHRRVGLDRGARPRPASRLDYADSQGQTCRLAAANVPTRAQVREAASDGAPRPVDRARVAPSDPSPPSWSRAGNEAGADAWPHVDARVPRPHFSECGRSISWGCSSGGCTSWPSGSPGTGWPAATGSRCWSHPAPD